MSTVKKGSCYNCHLFSSIRSYYEKDIIGRCLSSGEYRRITQHCNTGKYCPAYGSSPTLQRVNK